MKREDAERLVDEAIDRAHGITDKADRWVLDIDGGEREELAAAILAAVAERDRVWRAWVGRVERAFSEQPNMLFLEGYPPPDRQPEEPAR